MLNKNTCARIGILGVTGYAGREALSLLSRHPHVDRIFAAARSEVGSSFSELSPGSARGRVCEMDELPFDDCDIVLSCLPHGSSLPWVERALTAGCRVVDLSADLRVPAPEAPSWHSKVVYGLPELHRERIRSAQVVANPGCYPTAALLALAPLLRRGHAGGTVIIDAASGTTGAGRSAHRDLQFAEVAENFRPYSVGNAHRHLHEMRDQAVRLGNGASPELIFTPHLLPIRRGILETIHVPLREPLSDPVALWAEAYGDEPLVTVRPEGVATIAEVAGTNRAVISITPVSGTRTPYLTLVAAIDNLGKGAAGQAIQNLNLMLGFPETAGLA